MILLGFLTFKYDPTLPRYGTDIFQVRSPDFEESRSYFPEIDIGKPSLAFPVTPPCIRVRTRRFGELSL
jgi:hypothetical protein